MSDRLVLPAGLQFPRTLLDVSIEFDSHLKSGNLAGYKPIPTGFEPLDTYLGGGFVPENLMLVGGPPGTGKTVFTVQAARNIAAAAKDNKTAACIVCFEHSEVYLYHRLLCMESALGAANAGLTIEDIRRTVLTDDGAVRGLETLLESSEAARDAWARIIQYWERLFLIKGHPAKTTLNVLDTYLTRLRSQFTTIVLFVDYLQKVPVYSPGVEMSPERQIRTVTEGLKNLALAHGVAVVAVAAADSDGLKSKRVRFEDLWGGSSVNYEPDIALILNPAQSHARNQGTAIVFSIEKNRQGPMGMGFRHVLRGQYFSFVVMAEEK